MPLFFAKKIRKPMRQIHRMGFLGITPSTAEAISKALNVARFPRVSILPQTPQAAGGGEGLIDPSRSF